MALILANFAKASGAASKAPRVHSYTTPDDRATVGASGYFNNLAKTTEGPLVEAGDFVLVRAVTGGTPISFVAVIDTITSGVVTTKGTANFAAIS